MSTHWWNKFPTSPPLDQGAGKRFKKREGRMNDVLFQAACKLAGLQPTKRQARKWNNGKGKALLFSRDARKAL